MTTMKMVIMMRSLSKEPEIQAAATYIVNALKNKFSKTELQYEKEIEKLRKERAVMKVQLEELDD